MENLTLEDVPPPGGPLGQGLPPQQQLPPQMFTTAAQLLDMTDSKMPLDFTAHFFPGSSEQILGRLFLRRHGDPNANLLC